MPHSLRSLLLLAALTPAASAQDASPSYQLSWIGNSGAGAMDGKRKMRAYVQMDAKDAFVLPDGTLIAQTWFDEGHQEVTLYKDGSLITRMPKSHYAAGLAVTADAEHIYMSMQKGKDGARKNLVRRYSRRNPDEFKDFEISSGTKYKPTLGLAVTGSHLVLSDQMQNKIISFDKATMTESHAFDLDFPRKLTVDKANRIWVIVGPNGSNTNPGTGAVIRAFEMNGTPVPGGEISEIGVPTAIALDHQGRLMIADSTPGVNHIAIYDISAKPKRVATFGSCITSGTPGEVRPDKFDHITGIGTDASGNFYVVWNGGPHNTSGRVASEAQGLTLVSLTPDAKLRWAMVGRHFIDSADIDPKNEKHVYAKNERYEMDYTKPAGKQWAWKAYTLDRKRYPHDPRLWQSHMFTSQMLRLEDRLFMITQDQYRDTNTMYRFDGEIAVPCVMFSGKTPGEKPPNRIEGKFLWRDGSGATPIDGSFQTDEFSPSEKFGWGFASWSANGDVWCVPSAGNRIVHYPFLGLDQAGIPKYTEESANIIPMPAEFSKVAHAEYDSARDIMFLAGFLNKSEEKDYGGGTGKTNFRWILRYDDWSKSLGKIAAKTKIELPDVVNVAFTFSGDWIFAGERQGQPIRAYDSRNGELVQHWKPGREVGGPDWYGGGLDVSRAIRAARRSNGEILVFSEEVSYAKILLHRWTPPRN